MDYRWNYMLTIVDHCASVSKSKNTATSGHIVQQILMEKWALV